MFNEETKKQIELDKIKLREKLGRSLNMLEVATINEKYFIPNQTTRGYENKMKKFGNQISNGDDVYNNFYEIRL